MVTSVCTSYVIYLGNKSFVLNTRHCWLPHHSTVLLKRINARTFDHQLCSCCGMKTIVLPSFAWLPTTALPLETGPGVLYWSCLFTLSCLGPLLYIDDVPNVPKYYLVLLRATLFTAFKTIVYVCIQIPGVLLQSNLVNAKPYPTQKYTCSVCCENAFVTHWYCEKTYTYFVISDDMFCVHWWGILACPVTHCT